ncbi:hypothetical protein [Lactobacillus delbrueckii]|uniref:hypothetical protein n=1 Tax=Lactobacillus delbrueckii TaxID=1584 RepID=UPI000A2FCA06|nr:hypothetical protein [Lactobacillus delbrueckii]ARR37708.1 hypothetical protein B9N98_06010 [Lactobacillus delbrueckii subsp. delbrueckii]
MPISSFVGILVLLVAGVAIGLSVYGWVSHKRGLAVEALLAGAIFLGLVYWVGSNFIGSM